MLLFIIFYETRKVAGYVWKERWRLRGGLAGVWKFCLIKSVFIQNTWCLTLQETKAMPIDHRTLGSLLYWNQLFGHSDNFKDLARCAADQYRHLHEINANSTTLPLGFYSFSFHLGWKRPSYFGLCPSPLWSCGPWIVWGYQYVLSFHSVWFFYSPHKGIIVLINSHSSESSLAELALQRPVRSPALMPLPTSGQDPRPGWLQAENLMKLLASNRCFILPFQTAIILSEVFASLYWRALGHSNE